MTDEDIQSKERIANHLKNIHSGNYFKNVKAEIPAAETKKVSFSTSGERKTYVKHYETPEGDQNE
jgi:hypothetical protein